VKQASPRLAWPQLAVLVVSALSTAATWFAFMLKIPAVDWSGQPLPFNEIQSNAWVVGPMSDTTAFLAVLLLSYFVLVWVVWRADADFPAGLILVASVASGIFAALTYALFAEDVNVVLANVWTYAVAGYNPYVVTPNAALGNPFDPFIGWGGLEYVYGPAWLVVGAGLMKLIGPGIVANVMGTKVLMMLTLWTMGAIAWWLARARGSDKPVAAAALVALNPLLLADGVMTPHLDLPMAAALMAALLAWATWRDTDAVALFVLSIMVKLITVVVAPVVGFGLALTVWAGRTDGRRRRRLLILAGSLVATMLAMAALWPGVWKPFLDYGMKGSLDISANSALLANAISGAQATGVLPSGIDPTQAAKQLRWPLFLPFWVLCSGIAAWVAWIHRRELPYALVGPMALIMLGYNLLFTVWLLPWHLIAALCLCLVGSSRTTRSAGVLVTASGILLYLNAQWAWDFGWEDPRAVGWVLGGSLVFGPIIALALLLASAIRSLQARPSAP
jgi:hypothetical protein